MPPVLWTYRSFIWKNAVRELAQQYAGSVIGLLWHVIMPLFQILLFTIVFSNIMTIRNPALAHLDSSFAFAIYLCSGLIPWFGFAEALNRNTNSFLHNATYLKRLGIPELVFTAKTGLGSFLSMCIGACVLVVIYIVLGHYPRLAWLVLPAILLLFQGFAFGLGLALGVINVFFRDVGQGLPLVVQLWFWSTPIVYTESVLPDALQAALLCNPAYPFIHSLHTVLVDGRLPSLGWFLGMAGVCLAALAFGALVLRALRNEIRDVI